MPGELRDPAVSSHPATSDAGGGSAPRSLSQTVAAQTGWSRPISMPSGSANIAQ